MQVLYLGNSLYWELNSQMQQYAMPFFIFDGKWIEDVRLAKLE